MEVVVVAGGRTGHVEGGKEGIEEGRKDGEKKRSIGECRVTQKRKNGDAEEKER
jgi:hypothetical protein